MSMAIFMSMLSVSFVLSISPGPVNLMIVSSGINYGFKKTFAFISGATIGFTLLLALIAFGFDRFIEQDSFVMKVLELVGALFIIYMGYKIATSNSHLEDENIEDRYLKFYEGFVLQWLNPKAYFACISGVSMFNQSQSNLIIFVVLYFVVCYCCLSFWGVFGQKTTIFLNTQRRLKLFNLFMGGLLILPAIFLIVINVLK